MKTLLEHNRGLKRAAERSIRESMLGSRMFPAVRDAYQICFDRTKFASRKQALDFYARFISRGDLVFDVGANEGEYSDLFLALGAQVVAIEPNPACRERLRMVARRRGNLLIEDCAVGDSEGAAVLRIGSASQLSTLSNEWYEMTQTSPAYRDVTWSGARKVRVMTLDGIAAKYGRPKFVKIDVEGFEDRVLRGMTFHPDALSFEFHWELHNIVNNCMNTTGLKEQYRFNYTIGWSYCFESSDWMDAQELEKSLANANRREDFGDIFCIRERFA